MLMITCERAVTLLCGGVMPTTSELEAVTAKAFEVADQDKSNDITLFEFLQWAGFSETVGRYLRVMRAHLGEADFEAAASPRSPTTEPAVSSTPQEGRRSSAAAAPRSSSVRAASGAASAGRTRRWQSNVTGRDGGGAGASRRASGQPSPGSGVGSGAGRLMAPTASSMQHSSQSPMAGAAGGAGAMRRGAGAGSAVGGAGGALSRGALGAGMSSLARSGRAVVDGAGSESNGAGGGGGGGGGGGASVPGYLRGTHASRNAGRTSDLSSGRLGRRSTGVDADQEAVAAAVAAERRRRRRGKT